MPLTATQRDFLIQRLGVKPKVKGLHIPSKTERQDNSIREHMEDYLRREAKVLEAINTLRSVPRTADKVRLLEAQLASVQRAVAKLDREGGAKGLEKAYKELDDIKDLAQAEAKKAEANRSYYAAFDTASKDLEALRRHAQRAHVAGEIETASRELLAAHPAAERDDFTAARAAVVRAQAACDTGKDCADKYAAFLPFKADAGRAVASLKGVFADKSKWQGYEDRYKVAAAKADPPTRDYADAETEMQSVITELKNQIEQWYVVGTKAEIAKLQLKATALEGAPGVKPGGSVVQPALDAINKLQKQIEDDLKANKFGQAVMAARSQLQSQIAVGLKVAQRRADYDLARAVTVGKIDALKSHKSLLGQIFSMNKLVERADGLASATALRMEAGIAELAQIDATCAQLGAVAGDAEKYLEERVLADADQIELMKQPAIAQLQDQVDSIDALLAQARKTTGIVDAKTAIVSGLNMEDHQAFQQDWAGALKQVKEARALIKAAGEMAASLKDTAKALDGVGDAKTLEQVSTAVAELRKQAETARAQAHKEQAAHEFGHIFPSLDEALAQAKDGLFDIAAVPLKGAAELLLTARTVQAEYGHFDTQHKALAGRAKLLNDATDPPALSIKGRIDKLQEQLDLAAERAKAREWHAMREALAAAETAATEAELAARLRKEFDARIKLIEPKGSTLGVEPKKAFDAVLLKARTQADAFNYDWANRFLDNAEAQLSAVTVAGADLSTPQKQAEFMAAVKAMLKAKGGEELLDKTTDSPHTQRGKSKKAPDGSELLDAVVKSMGDNVTPKMLALIAKERFGVDFFVSALYVEGGLVKEELRDAPGSLDYNENTDVTQRGRSGRRMYDMLALVPEQSKDNPSMKRVERRDALKTLVNNTDGTFNYTVTNGGFYQSRGDLVVMSGRPGDVNQKFGSNISKELPAVEKGFEPADENPVDYFDFAVVHEVGHAIDDRMGFMASREGQANFGGWITHGGNIEPIVKAVAKHSGYDDTAEQLAYVSDVILGNTPDVPAAPEGQALAWEEARQKVHDWYTIATNESLWWSQSDTDKVTIEGRVYQEAYKGTWVSYLASARAKGMTGYQFRAPGEWFAELYACFHMGKLKSGHPARQWLSSLAL
jgi:hypothetical protein